MASPAPHLLTFSTHPTCRIVIDSCSDVSRELAQRLGVDVIEFPFVLNGEEHWDDLGESMAPSEFYGRMRSGERASTSAIPTGVFADIFEQFARQGIPTLYLSFTAGLSSSVHDAETAAAQVRCAHPTFELSVLDNRAPALTAGLLAQQACKMRDEGVPMAEIADWADEACNRIHGYFTLESLTWLAAGGRIPKAAASVSSLLNVKPDLTYDLDGSLTLMGVSRGRKKALKWVVDQMREHWCADGSLPLGIVDADCKEDADALEAQVRALCAEKGVACPEIIRFGLDPTIGAHVGPGMVALAFWGTDRRELSGKRGKR